MERQTTNVETFPAPAEPLGRTAALSRYLAPLRTGRGVLLWGEPLRPVAAAAAVWGLTRGPAVLVIDAANRFDPYGLVREARRLGLAREDARSRVRVARAFTSHQLVRLLKEGLPEPLPSGLVLVLGPATLFYDEQVPLAERRRLFKDLVGSLSAVKDQAPLLLLQPPLPRGATNRHFGKILAPLIDLRGVVEEGREIEDRGSAAALLPGPPASPAGARPRRDRLICLHWH